MSFKASQSWSGLKGFVDYTNQPTDLLTILNILWSWEALESWLNPLLMSFVKVRIWSFSATYKKKTKKKKNKSHSSVYIAFIIIMQNKTVKSGLWIRRNQGPPVTVLWNLFDFLDWTPFSRLFSTKTNK